jgi:hypothetical protein
MTMRTTHRARRAGLALVALLFVLATACSEDPERADTESISADGNDGTSAQQTDETNAPEPPPDEERPPDEEPSSDAEPPANEPPGEPLASTTVPIGFIDGGELDMAVTDLAVTGDLMRVAVTFTATLPIEAEEVAIGAVVTANESAPAAGISPEVIDPVNLKAYEAVAGAVPNGTGIYIEDGAPHTLVFYFAAPQDQMETVDVVISSEAPPITDIPFPQ